MFIKCWGSRGSLPVSGNDFVVYGGDTTCMEIRTQADDIIIIDAGSGIRRLGLQLFKEKRKELHLLLTHSHWDHILGFPFFKPVFFSDAHLHVHGCPFTLHSVRDMLSFPMTQPFFPLNYEDIPATVDYHAINEQPFSIGSLEVTPFPLSHPNQGMGYKFVEGGVSFVFLTDNELTLKHPGARDFQDYVDFCTNCDLVIHDAEYTRADYQSRKGWGHSVYEDALDMALAANVKALGLFHHNQERTDAAVDELVQDCRRIIEEKGVSLDCFASAQNMEITLDWGKPLKRVFSNAGAGPAQIEEGHPSAAHAPHVLQQMQIEKEEEVQTALASANDEIRQLKTTVTKLREELEKESAEKNSLVQRAVAEAKMEIDQLKETVVALRASMEEDKATHEESVQETKRCARDESQQLKKTIAVLREKLEENHGE
jgi:phosphoribosyl 1,2-cyclic phosphodiesterase